MKYLYWIGGLWLISTIALFALFAIVVRIQRFVKNRPKWVKTTTILHWWPIIAIGIAWDFVYQYTWAILLFLEFPLKGEYLLTQRLQRYLRGKNNWRYRQSAFWCRLIHRIDPWHCY